MRACKKEKTLIKLKKLKSCERFKAREWDERVNRKHSIARVDPYTPHSDSDSEACCIFACSPPPLSE